LKKIDQKEALPSVAIRKFRICRSGNLHLNQKARCGELAPLLPRLRAHRAIENLSIHFPEGAVVSLQFRKEPTTTKAQFPEDDCYSLKGIRIGVEFVVLGMEAIREIEKELSRFSPPQMR